MAYTNIVVQLRSETANKKAVVIKDIPNGQILDDKGNWRDFSGYQKIEESEYIDVVHI